MGFFGSSERKKKAASPVKSVARMTATEIRKQLTDLKRRIKVAPADERPKLLRQAQGLAEDLEQAIAAAR